MRPFLAGLERTHSLMVIGASGQNQIATLATAMSALTRWSQSVDATLYLKGEMECA